MPDSDSLEAMLTSGLLFRMAGEATFARGVAYAGEGRVQELSLTDGMLKARVAGTETYQVRLWKHGAQVEFDCTCPVGDALRFCKHGVAAGLAWLASAKGEPCEVLETPPLLAASAPREDPLERIDAYLEGLDASALRELLLTEAVSDGDLRERLLVREAAQNADPAAVRRMRAAIDRAADTAGFVDYEEASAYAGGLDHAVDGIAAMMKANPAAAIQLAEHAIRRVERMMEHGDDSGDELAGVLERLHLDACREARPDPVPLARRLFKAELASGCGTFSGAVKRYAAVLGDSGTAEYRRLAQAAWERLPREPRLRGRAKPASMTAAKLSS